MPPYSSVRCTSATIDPTYRRLLGDPPLLGFLHSCTYLHNGDISQGHEQSGSCLHALRCNEAALLKPSHSMSLLQFAGRSLHGNSLGPQDGVALIDGVYLAALRDAHACCGQHKFAQGRVEGEMGRLLAHRQHHGAAGAIQTVPCPHQLPPTLHATEAVKILPEMVCQLDLALNSFQKMTQESPDQDGKLNATELANTRQARSACSARSQQRWLTFKTLRTEGASDFSFL